MELGECRGSCRQSSYPFCRLGSRSIRNIHMHDARTASLSGAPAIFALNPGSLQREEMTLRMSKPVE